VAKIKFKLELNGERIDDIGELKNACQTLELVQYYKSGKLIEWLHDRSELDIVEAVKLLPDTIDDEKIYTGLMHILSINEFKAYNDFFLADDAESEIELEIDVKSSVHLEETVSAQKIKKVYEYKVSTCFALFEKLQADGVGNNTRMLTAEELQGLSYDEILNFVLENDRARRFVSKVFGDISIPEIVNKIENDEYQGSASILIAARDMSSPQDLCFFDLLNNSWDIKLKYEEVLHKDIILVPITDGKCDFLSLPRLKHENKIVIDRFTGLMWTFPSKYTYSNDSKYISYDVYEYMDIFGALEYAKNLKIGSYKDWMLPDKTLIKTAKAIFLRHKSNVCSLAKKHSKEQFLLETFWTIDLTPDEEKAYYINFANMQFETDKLRDTTFFMEDNPHHDVMLCRFVLEGEHDELFGY